jgi:hypothetical protein
MINISFFYDFFMGQIHRLDWRNDLMMNRLGKKNPQSELEIFLGYLSECIILQILQYWKPL